MRALIRAGSFYARDRVGRAAAVLAVGLAVLVPRALLVDPPSGGAAGFREGLAAGAGGGGAVFAGLWGLFLLAAVLVLWGAIVSGSVTGGAHRTPLVRPVWRPGYFLARHGAALLLLAALALAAGLVLGGAGSGASLPGLVGTALLTGWSLGGLTLLLSSVLDRGDTLAAVALFLAPFATDGLRAVAGPAAGSVGALQSLLPPMGALRGARHALLAGGGVGPGDLAAIAAYGAAALLLALLRLRAREYRPG